MEKKLKIIDPIGLHARPASIMVKEANNFASEIKLFSNNKEANLKSIMSVMALGVKNNSEIKIVAIGKDEEEALKSIEKVMQENNLID